MSCQSSGSLGPPRPWFRRTALLGAFVALFAVLTGPVAAQELGRVTGQVTARSMQPLGEVQVYLQGTSQGTLTGSNGRFLIPNVAVGTYTIRVDRIGYESQTQEITVTAGAVTTVDFTLADQALGLDEIVVTGTAGAARRREVGNSISQINVADIAAPPANVDQLLQSKAPGLTVTAGNGSVGGGAQIRLRGAVSVSQSNQPIVYIDGVRVRSEAFARNQQASFGAGRGPNVTASPLNDINPADIDRIEVIKGSAASTLYGTEAAAGVIQIFTKRGASGAARWTMQVDQGFSKLLPFAPDVDVRPPNDPQRTCQSSDPLCFEGGENYSYEFMNMQPYLRNGHRQKYALSVAGGGQSLQYFVSGQFDSNEGVLPLDLEDKVGLRGNFTFTPLPNLNVQLNTAYNRTDITGTPAGNNAQGLTLNAFRRERNYFSEGNPDSIRKVLDQDLTTRIDRFVIGSTLNFDPTPEFTNRLTVGYDQAFQDNRNLRAFGYFQAPRGILYTGTHSFETLTLDYVGSYRLSLGEDLATTLSVGGQSITSTERAVRGEGQNFAGPGEPTLNGATTQLTYEDRLRQVNAGFFGQALFAFKDRYFITAGIRVDGNSAFGQDLGLQSYPKISGSYVISEEPFWNESLGSLKLRGAFGESGRAPGSFDAIRTWNAVGYGGLPGFTPRNLGNPELGPERTAETELGFDWAGFDNRVTADFTFYQQVTTDALFSVRNAPSLGFTASQQENVGEIKNSGMELNLNFGILDRETWGFDLGANLYTNESEVISLGGSPAFAAGGGWVEEGLPVMAARGTTFRNGDQPWTDENGNPTGNATRCFEGIDPNRACFEDLVPFGPQQPTLVVGVSPTLRMPYGLELSARGEYQAGHYIIDGATAAGLSRSIRWPTCADYYVFLDAGNRQNAPAQDQFFCNATQRRGNHVYPADFFKLRDVTLRIPLGELIPRSSNSTLTISGQNWYRWRNADFPIFDPEMVTNTGFGNQNPGITEHIPPPASFVASLRIVF